MSGIEIKSATSKTIAKSDFKKASSARGGSSFSVREHDDNHSQISSPLTAQSIDPLFSNLFSHDDSQAASKKAEEVLDYLEKIRLSLIQGTFSSSLIETLTQSIQLIPQQNDEKLQSIINEIETRALVELAKIEKIKTL